jgi:hypothetical protein
MLIKEVISKPNNFPLLEADLIKDGQVVNALDGKFEWSETNQQFLVKEPGSTGLEKNKYVPQGTRNEWQILRAAGVIKKGGKLQKTLLTRFKNLFGKGAGTEPKEPGQTGFFGGIKQDMQGAGGLSNKLGAMVGSVVGQGLDKVFGDGKTYPKGYSMHFVSKKGEPTNVSLEQPYTDKDFKTMRRKNQLVKVRTVDGNRTFGVGVDKLVHGFAK